MRYETLANAAFHISHHKSEIENSNSEIKIIPTGYWRHPVYGDIKITEEDIAEKNIGVD